MQSFTKTTKEYLGTKLTHNELKKVGILDTLWYLLYTDRNKNDTMFLHVDEVIMPEADNKYTILSILGLLVTHMVCSTAKGHKYNHNVDLEIQWHH